MKHRGFTLIELLIFVAIFSVSVASLITILVLVTQVQSSQSAFSDVSTQSQFLVQQIQYYVQNARLVDLTLDTASSGLQLRESASTTDPTFIFLDNVTNGLLGYWPMDEGTGTLIDDFSGNAHNATATGAVGWATGERNGALSLNSAHPDYVNFGNISAFGGLTAMSVSAWVKTTQTNEAHIIDKSDCSGVANTGSWELLIGADFPGVPEFAFYKQGQAASDIQGGIVNDGKWHLVTATWDGSTMDLYVDGVMKATSPQTGSMHSGTQSLAIGGYCDGNPNYWNGQLDDVRVYNRALSTAEVGRLYQPTVELMQTSSGTTQNLTSNKVFVSSLQFTRHFNVAASSAPTGNDSVSFTFTMSGNGANGTQYSQTYQSSAAVAVPVGKIAMVQQVKIESNNASVSSLAGTYTTSNATGSLLLAVVGNQTSTSVSVSDSAGNTWTRIASSAYSGINKQAVVFAAVNAKHATNTVTATLGAGAGYGSLYIYEYRGAATASSFDASSTQIQSGTTAPSSGAANPTSSVELLFAVDLGASTAAPSAGTGFTLETTSTLNNVTQVYVEDMNQFITGPVSSTWKFVSSVSTTAILATFK